MKARIYCPAKSVTQSGSAHAGRWVLEYIPAKARSIDPVMGWTSSADMNSQVKVYFDTEEEACAYADRKGIAYEVSKQKPRKRHLRSYADNFR